MVRAVSLAPGPMALRQAAADEGRGARDDARHAQRIDCGAREGAMHAPPMGDACATDQGMVLVVSLDSHVSAVGS